MKKSIQDKNDKLFSKADILVLVTTIVLCLGLEIASSLPIVQNKIYENEYNKLIEQGHPDDCAKNIAKSQTQAARKSLYLLGLGGGFIGMGGLYIKKYIEFAREFKKIQNEYNHQR